MSRRPKILMLGWEFPPYLTGGLGTACFGLVNALNKYADITLIVPHSSKEQKLENVDIVGLNFYGLGTKPDEPVSIKKGVEVVEVDAELSPYPLKTFFYKDIKALTEPGEIRALYGSNDPYGANIMEKVATYTEVVVKVTEGKDFDVIHAHDWVTYPAALKLKELTGKPLVLHLHSLETDRVGEEVAKGDWDSVYKIEKQAMDKADRVIPVSNYTKECAVIHYGIDADKFYPVHNAINPEDIARIPNDTGQKIVLFLGRVTFQKGPEFMVDTAWKLIQRYPNVVFFVAGVGDMLDALKQLTIDRGIFDKFIFGGFLSKSNVKRILAMSDVYFMPSVSEPFGLSALEAAAADVPCVISNQSGVSEVLQFSLKADFWDTDKFANYIYALLNYEGIRQDTTERTRKIINELTWDDSAQDVLEVYKGLY